MLAASFGGLRATRTVLGSLPETLPVPILVVLHRAATSLDPLISILARSCALPLEAAVDGRPLLRGTVTVLPAAAEVRLSDDRTGGVVQLTPREGHRVSADDVMSAAAALYGAGAFAAVLTGKLADGAAGTQAIKRAGGTVIVQDPLECAAPGMPSAALATGCVDHRLPLALIAPMLIALTMAPGAAGLLRVPMAAWASPPPI